MRPTLFASAALGAALLAGCAGLTTPDDDGSGLAVRTEGTEYTVTRNGPFQETTIGVALTNGTGVRAYLPTCRSVEPPVLEKRVGDRWVKAYSPVVLLCLGPPEVVEPGETFSYTYRVTAGAPGTNIYPKFEVDEIGGTYRLVWSIYREWDPENQRSWLDGQFPREARISNEFTLRE